MFLRPHQRSKDGKEHTYWSLVETVRTPDGPRQKTLCYLGELNGSAQARWLKTIEVLLQRQPTIVPQPSIGGVNSAQPLSPMKALDLLSKLQSGDIVLPTTDGREIHLRRVAERTSEQESLLDQLGLNVPERLKSYSKCSADFAVA